MKINEIIIEARKEDGSAGKIFGFDPREHMPSFYKTYVKRRDRFHSWMNKRPNDSKFRSIYKGVTKGLTSTFYDVDWIRAREAAEKTAREAVEKAQDSPNDPQQAERAKQAQAEVAKYGKSNKAKAAQLDAIGKQVAQRAASIPNFTDKANQIALDALSALSGPPLNLMGLKEKQMALLINKVVLEMGEKVELEAVLKIIVKQFDPGLKDQ